MDGISRAADARIPRQESSMRGRLPSARGGAAGHFSCPGRAVLHIFRKPRKCFYEADRRSNDGRGMTTPKTDRVGYRRHARHRARHRARARARRPDACRLWSSLARSGRGCHRGAGFTRRRGRDGPPTSEARTIVPIALLDRRAFGALHALVNNAGRAPRVRADCSPPPKTASRKCCGPTCKARDLFTQAVARLFVEQQPDAGVPRAIVFVTSVSAEMASPHRGEYVSARRFMAAKLLPFASPHSISRLRSAAGIVATDMTAGVKDMYDKRIAGGLVPEGRWGMPDDVGGAVASLLRAT